MRFAKCKRHTCMLAPYMVRKYRPDRDITVNFGFVFLSCNGLGGSAYSSNNALSILGIAG